MGVEVIVSIVTVAISFGFLIVKVLEYRQKNKELVKENQKLTQTTQTVNFYIGQVVGSNSFPTFPQEAKDKMLSIQATTAGTLAIVRKEEGK